MKHIFILLIMFLFTVAGKAQVATGNTSVGTDGGGSTHAECTEILSFNNYNDNTAGGLAGQNFVFALQNGDSLYLNVQRSGNATYTLQPPATLGSSFGAYGYGGLTGNSDFYEINYGNMNITFSNIILKDHSGNIVPNYTMMVFDGEGTGNGEFITFTAPAGHNWYNWDSISAPSFLCTPARSGEGTNVAQITGDCNNTYYTSFGFAVDSPGSIAATIHGGGGGKEAIVLGIKRIIVAPNDTLCSNGGPVNININPVNASTGTTYTWPAPVVSPAGSITGGTIQSTPVTSISQTLTNTTNAAATITYTMSPVSCGLPGNSFTATVVLLPLHGTSSIQNICGSTATIIASGSGTWAAAGSNPVAATITSPNSSTTAVTGMTVNGNYQFVWTNSLGCTDSVILAVTNAGPPPQLTATNTSVCPGDSVTLCAPGGFSNYSWNTGASGICITTAPANTYYYAVTVTDNSGCTVASNQLGITVLPPVNAGADQVICGNAATMNATGIGAWSAVASNPVVAGITSPTSPNTTITGLSTAGSYQFIWTNGGGCSDTVKVTVTNSIAPPQPATNQTTLCSGDSATICVPTGFTTYLWNTGGTGSCITTGLQGSYFVTVTNSNGCSVVSSQLGITVLPPVNAGGNQNICGNAVTMAASGTGTWSALGSNPAVGNITSPTSSNTTITGLTANGNYQFVWTNGGGCSDTVLVVVSTTGTPPQLSANQTTICPGDSATICASSGYATYSWNTGDTTMCIATPYEGNYYVTVTENGGCSAASSHVGITVRPPTPVTVSVSGDTLFVYSAVNYQWYFNGNLIPGATMQTYIASATGDYTVQITDTNGCKAISSEVLITGITGVERDYLSLYPNPSEGSWHLEVSDKLIGSELQIFDAEGRLVFRSEIKTPHSEIAPDIARGIYWMQINPGGNMLAIKLVRL